MKFKLKNGYKIHNGFSLYGPSSIHTISGGDNISRSSFLEIYHAIYRHVKYARKANPNAYNDIYHLLLSDNPFKDKHSIYSVRAISLPQIAVSPGLRIKLSLYGEFGYVLIIADPALMVNGSKRDKDDSVYLDIAPVDFEFWKKFVRILKRKMSIWKIPNRIIESFDPIRIDFCMNVEITRRFNMKSYFNYLRIMPKPVRFEDKNKMPGIDPGIYEDENEELYWFRKRNKYENMVKFGNSLHSILMYDKGNEQHVHFNRKIRRKILRFEYQTTRKKFISIIAQAAKLGLLGEEAEVYGINLDDMDLASKLYLASKISVHIITLAIDEFFPFPDMVTEEKTMKKIAKIKCTENMKNAIREFVITVSNSNPNNINSAIKAFKDKYSSYTYYTVRDLLAKNNISPVFINNTDSMQYRKMPSPGGIIISAIANSIYSEENDILHQEYQNYMNNIGLDINE